MWCPENYNNNRSKNQTAVRRMLKFAFDEADVVRKAASQYINMTSVIAHAGLPTCLLLLCK